MSQEILSPIFERTDARGTFREVLNNGTWQALLEGRMRAGGVMGNHYHKETLIFFYIPRGSVSIKTIHVETGHRDEFALQAGQGVLLRTNESHAIRFHEESDFIILKSRRYDAADPDTFPFPVED